MEINVTITEEKLPMILTTFYGAVRQHNGKEYSTQSIKNIRYALQRYFKLLFHIDIVASQKFVEANRVFNAKMKNLKQLGLDVVTHKIPISLEDLVLMRQYFTKERDTPEGLVQKTWFDYSFYLCTRGNEGKVDLLINHIEIVNENVTGETEYLHLRINPKAKNYQGGKGNEKDTIIDPRMYATGKVDCPVKTVKDYLLKRNPANERVFQLPNKNFKEDGIWYKNKVMGIHTLESMMPQISKLAGLSRRYTNHSVRATAIKLLSQAGYNDEEITTLSKHKQAASLKAYNYDIDDDRKAGMTHILDAAMNGEMKMKTSLPVPKNPISNMKKTPEIATVSAPLTPSPENIFPVLNPTWPMNQVSVSTPAGPSQSVRSMESIMAKWFNINPSASNSKSNNINFNNCNFY